MSIVVSLWLTLCAVFALTPFVAALSCDIDLSLISSNETDPGFAQCDAGCDSCNFSIVDGYFMDGTMECLASVPCFVRVNGTMHLDSTIVNGSHASALSVYTDALGYPFFPTGPWHSAAFHTPLDGDFRFEAHNTRRVLSATTFYAGNSGVLDFVIHSNAVNTAPELLSTNVHASTAKELNIWLGEDTHYSEALIADSYIQCPAQGKCKWQSNGHGYSGGSPSVFLSTFPGTDLRLLCENTEACARIEVRCVDDSDILGKCEMQYDSDWQCVDTWNSVEQCSVTVNPTNSTTTAMPVYSTTPVSTVSESMSKRCNFLVYGLVLGSLALFI